VLCIVSRPARNVSAIEPMPVCQAPRSSLGLRDVAAHFAGAQCTALAWKAGSELHVVRRVRAGWEFTMATFHSGVRHDRKDLIDGIDKGPVLDVALIGAAQKVEHYEIASYTTLITLAGKLGYDDALPLLQASLAEEKATDEKLGKLGQAAAIEEAATAGKN
jgi:hypothetical protein